MNRPSGSRKRAFATQEPLAILAALCLFVCSAFASFPKTPEGVHCPTAQTQLIAVPLCNCCGKIVGYEKRAPRPGEQGFEQCHCLEKRSAQQKAVTTPKFELFVTDTPRLEAPTVIPEANPIGLNRHIYLNPTFPPPARPPILA